MRHFTILIAGAALAGCGQSTEQAAKNETAAAPKEKTPYCFFKDADAKGWAASVDKDGNVVVKGKLFREDPRYKAILEKPNIVGTAADVWPNIAQNDTGFAAQDNWWDVKLTVPGSAAVTKVAVRCGAKTFASLDVPRKK